MFYPNDLPALERNYGEEYWPSSCGESFEQRRYTRTSAASDQGDSGSLIVSSGSKQPVALLFAGSATHTFANPIDVVMNRLGIDRIYVKDTP
jgi:hypothetical protein